LEESIMATRHLLDPATESAALIFLERAAKLFPIKGTLVFGSRARGNYRPDSDADLAILMAGSAGDFSMTTYKLGKLVFDVLMETGIEIQPVPIWEDEWEHPETYSNPIFLGNVAREGVRV
jgi:predicted nucleotidyltransferase